MKKLVFILILAASVVSCATQTSAPNLTPVARNAYNLTQLVNSIGILQTTAENSVPNNVLKLNTARSIVEFCVWANTTIGQTPNGWFATVKTGYTTMKNLLTQDELNKFGIYLTTFEVVLNSFNDVYVAGTPTVTQVK